ncbi:exopolyphosphatase-like protein [Venturia nashicola]|uniref:Exopolyphosphatase-like protein n=1 Tax=Venturia nashicola TaxID=86259 RepID=A0A4Z1P4T3_9PEZI|nr:exopolyphosphatase-like protein [Venturia nashicola]
MAFPRTSVRNFLIQAKASLRTARSQGQQVTFVIGNESADLDSFASAILYAYIRSSYIRSSGPTCHATAPFYVPVTNIPAADISLRPEFLALLPHANLEREHIITLDDLPQTEDTALEPDQTRWILVDHNALQGTLGQKYAARVAGAIDHHDDENIIPMNTGSEPRIIAKTGSCCSLVTNYCREAWDALSSSAQSPIAANARTESDNFVDDASYASLWDSQVAKLALAAVLIDTTNLKAEDKVTDHDVEAVKILESKIASSSEGSKDYNRDNFFNEISDAKKDIAPLKLYDILRKDYKQWTEGSLKLGVSSVVKPIDFLVKKAKDEAGGSESDTDAFVNSLKTFATDRELDVMAVMTTFGRGEGHFQRELLVWAISPASSSAAAKFEQQSTAELGLVPWHGSANDIDYEGQEGWRRVWQQGAVQHSRKRVAPLLREAMI